MRTLITSALISTALLFAPTAQATPQDYVNDLTSIGVYHKDGPQALAQAGEVVCEALKDGMAPQDIAKAIYDAAHVTEFQAQKAVDFAIKDICPDVVQGHKKLV